jgi:hypothetical protein
MLTAHTHQNRCVSRAKKHGPAAANVHASRKGSSLRWRDRGRLSSWGSLKYDDRNKDNKIDRSDAVFKLLRLWVDINGDGTAGTMETFTLDMDYVGVDMAKLKASLDAAGQQALAALQQLKVQRGLNKATKSANDSDWMTACAA